MAIGRSDTDKLYDRFMRRAIEDAGLIPLRVDRIVHNDRIDHRIREEITRADVVVADLTYARPSVYWEAGFAERMVPVVYTCRSDHLRPERADHEGNLAVHFDLRNANIITWPEAGSQRFARDLTKRLLHVTRGLRSKREEEEAPARARAQFTAMSPAERAKQITLTQSSLLRASRFREARIDDRYRTLFARNAIYNERAPLSWAILSGTVVMVLAVPCQTTFTNRELSIVQYVPFVGSRYRSTAATWGALPEAVRALTRRRVRRLRRIKVVPVLAQTSFARLQRVMEFWRPARAPGWFYYPTQSNPPRDEAPDTLPSSYEIVVVDDIRSIDEFADRFSQVIGLVRESPRDYIIDPVASASA